MQLRRWRSCVMGRRCTRRSCLGRAGKSGGIEMDGGRMCTAGRSRRAALVAREEV